jgi:hypothetical protein
MPAFTIAIEHPEEQRQIRDIDQEQNCGKSGRLHGPFVSRSPLAGEKTSQRKLSS